MKYRKKPVVIEAVRYMIDNSLPDWFMNKVSNNTIILHGDGTCHIKTLEGTMKSEYGDYIIRGVNGEVYPCKPDIFQKTYEPENDEDGQTRRLIDDMQTAYDMNAVVNTLQQQAVQYHSRAEKYARAGVNHEVEHMAGKAASYEHAIEIVKGGGIDVN